MHLHFKFHENPAHFLKTSKKPILNQGFEVRKKLKPILKYCVAVVVEWLPCLPVTQKIGVRFYLERESNATSDWINVGCGWCCRGWSIEGGTPGGLYRTRDGLPRIRKARAARNVHECESVCAWNKNIVSAPKWLPCMNACMCAVFHCICICMCSN